MESAQSDISTALWRVELFGALTAHRNGTPIDRFPTQKVGALLAMLAFYPRQRHTREKLIDSLWPDADMTAARNRLSQALVWLRPQLEPDDIARGSVLIADRLTIGLNPQAFTTDVADFTAAIDEASRTQDQDRRRDVLTRAVGLYRDELLSGYYSDWIFNERQRLLNAYVQALRDLASISETDREIESALGFARRAVDADPLQEEAHGDVIRLLAAAGQAAAAMRQYQELKSILDKELGLEPSAAVRSLVNQIRENVTVPAAASPVKPPRAPSRAAALPTPLTRLFGREAEIERVRGMVLNGGARLVTIIGPGGSGKTRLSLAAGADLAEAYSGAVAFVPLADLDDAQMIVPGIAAALRLPPNPAEPPVDQIVGALTGSPFLLTLDNLEHLIDGAAPVVRELLDRVPTLTVLATSRQRLGLDGEREIMAAPLSVPTIEATPATLLGYASVQLFLDRAQAVRPNFTITAANAKVIAQVCERLEGIPLAIELCAAWAQTLMPAQMLEKLDHRFDLLVSRRADINPRHRTLRAALDYSYLQLPQDLRDTFKTVSVFRGSWSLEAAESILGETSSQEGGTDWAATLAALTQLRERSLIFVEETHSQMRFRMLDSLREFAMEQLSPDERAAARRIHAAYFLRIAEQAGTGLTGSAQDQSLTILDFERENLRSALTWSLETEQCELGLRLAGALGSYWVIRGSLQEGVRWLERLLAVPGQPSDSAVYAKAWSVLGHLTWSQGDYPTARVAHERALELRRSLGDIAGVAESLYHLGITSYREDDYATARTYFDESLALATERNDQAGISRVLLNLGNIAQEEQRYDEAREYTQRSLEIEQRLGNRHRIAAGLNNLALITAEGKDYARADLLFQEALVIHKDLSDSYGAAIALANLSSVASRQGQRERAQEVLSEGLQLAHEVGNKHIIAFYLNRIGILETAAEHYETGVAFLAGAQRLMSQLGSSLGVTDGRDFQQSLDAARAALPSAAFDSAWARGEIASLSDIVTMALDAVNPSLPGDSA